jgi:hypothetical protein
MPAVLPFSLLNATRRPFYDKPNFRTPRDRKKSIIHTRSRRMAMRCHGDGCQPREGQQIVGGVHANLLRGAKGPFLFGGYFQLHYMCNCRHFVLFWVFEEPKQD